MKTVREKTVLITGASSGFGSHLVEAFSSAGFNVVGCGRDRPRLAKLQKNISVNRRKPIITICADLKTKAGLARIKKALKDNDVDVLINNAAINPELVLKKSLLDVEEMQEVFLVNTVATIQLCHAAHEYFIKRNGGAIININSVAGLVGSGHEQTYAASKFALRGFSESVKDIWLKQGVRMMDIYSGALAVGMSSDRSDVDSLIDPQELAEFLVGMCKTDSFFVREISMQRTKR